MSEAPPPEVPAAPPPAGGGKTNGLAIASLILGIASLVMCLGPLAGIPGVICGHMALGRIKASGQGGRGMAIAGLVMGYLGIVVIIIFFLLGGLAFIFGAGEMSTELTPPIDMSPPPGM